MSKGAYLAGPTPCQHCGHVDVSVRPVGTVNLECSMCGGFSEDPAAGHMVDKAGVPLTTCQNYLRNLGGAWPRSCPTCGLAGACRYGIEDKQ